MQNFFLHNLSDVKTNNIGKDTKIWQFTVIQENVVIGVNCNIGSHCFIENGVRIGDNVTIKNGNYIFDGVIIEDNVFIGPNSTFTNDKFPKSRVRPTKFPITLLKRGCSIGGGVTLLPGITVGEDCLIGAGSVVTKNVPPNSIIAGNPAIQIK